ncbi:MAG TPA: carboxylesterase family protein [Acidobacteriota bacterium]|nr:carboxylesterase family protein [Acidobacteriota bacterium]
MKNKYCFTAFLILAFAVSAAPPLAAAIKGPVKTKSGKVSGISGTDPSITAFKGIPFAAPPVGELRWRAPQPPKPWHEVRAAEKFGASCIQNIVQERKPWTYEFMTHGEISEDCLSLNVWTGAKSPSERRPVFFYIYGGGFSEGSGAVPAYDGEGLAKKGLVVITANYRIGVLGFLAHPELSKESSAKASGNYGLLDQVAVLRWIQDNIKAFGGDPNRVTIAGQSAGGMSVHSLIASPLAKGLFHRAIVQSGGSSVGGGGISLGARGLASAEADGVKFAESKGTKSLAELRALSWQQLTAAAPAGTDGRNASPMLRFSPIVDGYVLPAAVRDIVAEGKQNDVPTLTGANTGELGGLMAPQGPTTVEAFVKLAQQQYGPLADEFLKLYPATTDEEAAKAQADSSRDQALVSLYLWSRERARTSRTNAFLYLWDHALPGPDAARFGAFHTSEVPYVLNTLYMSDRPFVEADRKIADMMSSYWANFAGNGDPNGKGLPRWNPAGGQPEIMELGDKAEPISPAGSAAKFSFFEKFLTQPART